MQNRISKLLLNSTQVFLFLVVCAVFHMAFLGAVDFGITREAIIKATPYFIIPTLLFIILFSAALLVINDWLNSKELRQLRFGLCAVSIEAIILIILGSLFSYVTDRPFGNVCIWAGIAGFIGIIFKADAIKNAEKSDERTSLFKKPVWAITRKKAVSWLAILLFAWICSYRLSYFNFSVFEYFAGWSVGNGIHALQEPLLAAIRKGDEKDVGYLIDKWGAAINGKRYHNEQCIGTPIEVAASPIRYRIFEELLDRGAILETCKGSLIAKLAGNFSGTSAEKILFDRGMIKSNEQYDGQYLLPLIVSKCLNTRKEMSTEQHLRLYLEGGANPNIDEGRTLYIAAKRNCEQTVQVLLENGADANKRYEKGMTILQLIEKGIWKKPDGEIYNDKFTPELIDILKNAPKK